jgi:hypothetical protein
VAHWPLVNYSQCIINAFLIIRQNVHAIWPVKSDTKLEYSVKSPISLRVFNADKYYIKPAT